MYYTAGANTAYPQCGNQPAWAGLVCRTGPAAPPSAGPALPTTTTTKYSWLLAPAAVTETSGSVTRTTTSFLADGRADTSKTVVAGLPGSAPVPATKTTYDPATGLVQLDATGAETSIKQTTGYDTWARVVSYTPAAGETTATGYDAAGRVDYGDRPEGDHYLVL